jgi:hypothetical protein
VAVGFGVPKEKAEPAPEKPAPKKGFGPTAKPKKNAAARSVRQAQRIVREEVAKELEECLFSLKENMNNKVSWSGIAPGLARTGPARSNHIRKQC